MAHLFTLNSVIVEHELCLVIPRPVFSDLDLTVKMQNSISLQRKSYDVFETYDIALSRLLVESPVSSTYRESIKPRFSHRPNFENLPRQVYYMMVIYARNTSVVIDVKTTKTKFYKLSLSNFPGENISQFAVLALKHIKIMKGEFSLTKDLGSTLIMKASKAGTDIFNRQVMDQYTHADALN